MTRKRFFSNFIEKCYKKCDFFAIFEGKLKLFGIFKEIVNTKKHYRLDLLYVTLRSIAAQRYMIAKYGLFHRVPHGPIRCNERFFRKIFRKNDFFGFLNFGLEPKNDLPTTYGGR